MTDIYYWNGVISDETLSEEYQRAINKLISNKYKLHRLEKLVGHRVYSFRVNEKARLLFTTIKHNKKNYLLLLEALENHEYDSSRFLKSGVLRDYLEKIGDAVIGTIQQFEFEAVTERLNCIENEESSGRNRIPLSYYNHQFISLSETQESALHVQLPAVISGAAGSGKSCIAMLLIENYVQTIHMTEEGEIQDKPIVYVCLSEQLAGSMRAHWQTLPISQQIKPERVQFMSYETLLRTSPATAGKEIVSETSFEKWFLVYKKEMRKRSKTLKQPVVEMEARLAYQEFRICSVYSSAEDYLKLGKRQSLLSQQLRIWLYEAFQAYQRHLDSTNCINLDFFRLDMGNPYGLVVVDEAQDCSRVQLDNLFNLANSKDIVLCAGTHQNLKDSQENLPYILQTLQHCQHIELPVAFRSLPSIIELANKVVEIKHRLSGGIAYKGESTHVVANHTEGQDRGHVLHLEPSSIETNDFLKEQARSVHFAVITLPEFKKEAIARFGTQLVFTPAEIKGLEYDCIVTYRLFEKPLLNEAFQHHQKMDKTKQPIHRAKSEEESDTTYTPCLNELFTAYTRAKTTLVVCEEETEASTFFIDTIRKIAEGTSAAPESDVHESSDEDWELEARRLVWQGNIPQAHDIFINRLQKSEDMFQSWLDALTSHQHANASLPEEGHASGSGSSAGEASSSTVLLEASNTPTKTSPSHSKKKKKGAKSSKTPQDEQDLILLLRDISKESIGEFLTTHGMDILYKEWNPFPNTSKQSTLLSQLLTPTKTRALTRSLKRPLVNNNDILEKLATELELEDSKNALPPQVTRLFVQAYLNYDIGFVNHFLIRRWMMALFMQDTPSIPEENVLYQFMKRSGGLKLLPSIFATNNNIIKLIPDDTWIQLFLKYPNLLNISNINAKKIILHLLEHKPSVVRYLPEETWDELEGINITNALHEVACIAARYNHPTVIAALGKKSVDFHKKSKDGLSPIYAAISEQKGEVLVEFANQGIKFNQLQLDNGFTYLQEAARCGFVASVVEIMGLEDFNAPGPNGLTPLICAALGGHERIVAWLARRGNESSLNYKTCNGYTAAYAAAMNGHCSVITELARYEAVNFCIANQKGYNPLHVAAENGHAKVVEALLKLDVIDINAQTEGGMTAVYLATTNGFLEALTALAKHAQVDLNKATHDSLLTPMHAAALAGEVKTLRELAKYPQTNLNAQTNLGATPAYFAAKMGHLAFLKELATYEQVDFELKTSIGITPLYIAAQRGYIEIVRLLLQKKCRRDTCFLSIPDALRSFTSDANKKTQERMDQVIRAQGGNPSIVLSIRNMAFIMGHDEIVRLLDEPEEESCLPSSSASHAASSSLSRHSFFAKANEPGPSHILAAQETSESQENPELER